MAIVCLSRDLADLQDRLARIVVGYTRDGRPVHAGDLKAAGAMAALLRDALSPNLVQTLEHNPAFIHGGPFANIAHGCNSVIATRAALKLADYVVTEAGFGADLGAEKFFDIKCRIAGFEPAAAVVVATVRALKMHGGVAKDALKHEDVAALERGFANLARHVRNVGRFGVPALVAINRFSADSPAEMTRLRELCAGIGVRCVLSDHWATGGPGAAELAQAVVELIETQPAQFRVLYPTTCRCGTSSAPSRPKSTTPARSRPILRSVKGSTRYRPPASATSRSASPRRSIASAPTRRPWVPRADMCSRSAMSGCRPAPASSSRSAARS